MYLLVFVTQCLSDVCANLHLRTETLLKHDAIQWSHYGADILLLCDYGAAILLLRDYIAIVLQYHDIILRCWSGPAIVLLRASITIVLYCCYITIWYRKNTASILIRLSLPRHPPQGSCPNNSVGYDWVCTPYTKPTCKKTTNLSHQHRHSPEI